MVRTRMHATIVLTATLALVAGIAGCRVSVDKGANGEEKKVQIDTPFGGVHVNTDQTTAADLGLPVYPGSQTVKDEENHKSADVHLGFGEWELRVKAVTYSTPDSKDKVSAFYKKALGRYGDVILCEDHVTVGSPAATSEGLTCSDDNHDTEHVQIDHGKHNLELKAGSKRHQHIVGFEDPKDGQTRFTLVALDLPSVVDNGSGKND